MAKERRRSPRITVDVPARLTMGDETVEGRLHDICRDAALVLASRSWPLETQVALETELPGVPGRVRASGRVVRLSAGGQGEHGMAVLFDELAPESALRVELFISDREVAKA